jgi:hypothetical protein
VLSLESIIQFGVCAGDFEARHEPRGEGVGDDEFSWAVDGVRQRKWPGEAWGSEWRDGQIIGFAVDMSKAGCGSLSVSVDGSFASPDGPAFDSIPSAWLSPAFSGSAGKFASTALRGTHPASHVTRHPSHVTRHAGKFRFNFGDTPFKHAAPDAEFVSVHEANMR